MASHFLAAGSGTSPSARTFPTAEDAAKEALALQESARGGMRIAFVSGLPGAAAVLFQLAVKGQILTDRQTVMELPPPYKAMTRLVVSNPEIYDLVWQEIIDGPGTTIV